MPKPIDVLLDCQHVRRWNLVCTTAESNVASHSFNVAMVALDLWRNMYNKAHIQKHVLVYFALMHDVDEAETGDIPTPTKAAMRERGVEPNTLFMTQGMEDDPPPEVLKIIKVADLIENFVFISNHGSGIRALRAASEVKGRLEKAIDGASEDLRRATRQTLDYILTRKSETDEERGRIAQDRERLRLCAEFNRAKAPPVVG